MRGIPAPKDPRPPLPLAIDHREMDGPDDARPDSHPRLRGGLGFKMEAAVFLAVILTFAGILWGDSLREKHLPLTDSGASFLPYLYTDRDNGGASIGQLDSKGAFGWSCELAPKIQYPYCGFGLQLAGSEQGHETLDLSRYERVTVRLLYHGAPTRLKFVLKNFDPAYRAGALGQDSMPVFTEFAVKEGLNTIELRLDRFAVEKWWIEQNKFPGAQPALNLSDVVALDFVTAGGAETGRFTASVQSIVVSGIWLTPTQWYLMILGMWLVLTGIFLVYRFFAVRSGYEVRQRVQERESRALALARVSAEAASDAKSQFLANMSHELRTPLNAILGYAQLLEREQLSDRQKTAVSAIHQSGNHLLTLITDILDLSKIEAGKLDLLTAPFNLRVCVAHVANMIRLRSEEKGLAFAVELDEDLPQQVVGDAKRIRQILLNLLGNAVKFTAAGELRLEVSVASWGEGNIRLRFDVIDTGTGIANDQIERLFEPFEQAGTAIDRGGGTGLGLSITRQLVRAMDGDVRVVSEVGQGTRFSVEITCELASASLSNGRPEPLMLAQAARVLVVDDDSTTCALLCAALAELGASASTAQCGASALEACAQQRPDLVLMDLKMPGMNGLAIIRQMKMSADLRDIPVIAISGTATAGAEADALAAGAIRLLQKPIDLAALAECLAPVEAEIAAPQRSDDDRAFALPPAPRMEQLLHHARAGNMRGVREEAQSLAELDPALRPFADRLCELAATYQSPAVLRMVEQNMDGREAA